MYISVLNLSLLLYLYHKSVPSMKISDSPSKKCHQSSKDSNWTHQGIKTNHRGRERERLCQGSDLISLSIKSSLHDFWSCSGTELLKSRSKPSIFPLSYRFYFSLRVKHKEERISIRGNMTNNYVTLFIIM